MNTPWLSVLVPVFNGAATLEQTLASVVDQAEGIEFILVDQGSDDNSVAIAESFAERMDVRIVSAPENKNWVQNTNVALGLARAPRATLLHQDDLWRPGRAAMLAKMFEQNPDAALWLHGAEFVDAEGRKIGALAPAFGQQARVIDPSEVMDRLIVQNTIPIPSAAFPVEAAKALGGLDEALWYTADWHLWLGLAAKGPTAWSSEKLAAFRLHSGSLTLSGSKDLDDLEAQLAIPLARHAGFVAETVRGRAVKQARTSNLLNVWLASVFHGERRPVGPVLKAVVALGPAGWRPFLRDTRIFARIAPRLRLMKRWKCAK